MKTPITTIYSNLRPGKKYSLRDIMHIGYSEKQIRRYFNSYSAVFNFNPNEKIISYEQVIEFIRNIDSIYNCSNNAATQMQPTSVPFNHIPDLQTNIPVYGVNIFEIPQYDLFNISVDIRPDSIIADQLSSAIDKLRANIEFANNYLKVLTTMYDSLQKPDTRKIEDE